MEEIMIDGVLCYKILFREMNEIIDNIYLIQKGVRSTYMTSITAPKERTVLNNSSILSLSDKLDKIEEYVKKEGLYLYAYSLSRDEYDLDEEESACIWIYKYSHQGEIIRSLTGSHSFVEEWITGKLLGYSDEAMENFLADHK